MVPVPAVPAHSPATVKAFARFAVSALLLMLFAACGGGSIDDSSDWDHDGLSNSTEQQGWTVRIVSSDGSASQRQVTSDPYQTDTDKDGIDDAEEYRRGTDPRASDSDADGLSDADEINLFFTKATAQDTDQDGIQDGDEVLTFKTHPGNTDTDGDGFSDFREIFELNRDPRVADLPRQQITVGEVRLQIDERYTFTSEEGQIVSQDSTTDTTLAVSDERRFERSEARYFEGTAQLSLEKTFSATPSFKLGARFGFKGSHTLQFTEGSTRTAQQAFERSLNKGQQFTHSLSVGRQVVGAGIDVDLTVENVGDVAFRVENLEVTVLAQNERDRSRFVPVGTLIPRKTLITGEPTVLNLGPLDPARGPIVFSSRDVFPNLVEGLMRQPRGLIFEIANFDLTDEFGRNFAFASQEIRDRTAEIVIDFGDNEVEHYFVAVGPALDDRNTAGGGVVGELDDTGKSTGIPLDFALQDILGFQKNSTVLDGILAGANRVSDSLAEGDDIQLIPAGTNGLPQDAVVISAGENGVLDTAPAGDDVTAVTTGYATGPTCNAMTRSAIVEPYTDGNGTADTLAQGDDEQLACVGCPVEPGATVIGPGGNGFIDTVRGGDDVLLGPGLLCDADADCPEGACTGREALKRVGNRSSGEFRRFWALLVENDVQLGADFGKVILRAGESIGLAFIQDFDRDGLLARQEYLYGSSDSSQDTDGDGLDDYTEILVGWDVGARGQPLRHVYPDPRLTDSDADGLGDYEESDLRVLGLNPTDFGLLPNEAIRTDPEQQDTDGDGVRDDEEVFGFLSGIGIVDPLRMITVGADGIAATSACNRACVGGSTPDAPCSDDGQCPDGHCDAPDCDDIQVVAVGERGLTPRTVVVAPGPNGIRDTSPISDDEAWDSGDGIAQTTAVGDDQQVASVGALVGPGGVIVKPGPNGLLDSTPAFDDVRLFGDKVVKTDPLDPDTDKDQVPDGAERTLGSDPTDPTDAGSFADTDEDGLTDVEEKLTGWQVTVIDENGDALPSRKVYSNPNVPDTDADGLPDFVERAIHTDPTSKDTDGDGISDFDEFADFEQFIGLNTLFPGFFLDGSSSLKFGTNPTMRDTDRDGLSDDFEIFSGWTVVVPAEGTVREVSSDPTRKDTDLDGLDDGKEARGADGELPFLPSGEPNSADSGDALDPTDPDTDGDGRLDGAELTGTCAGGTKDGDTCSVNSDCIIGSCLGGPNDGQSCSTNSQCATAKSCLGGADDEYPCEEDTDCLDLGLCEAGGPHAGQQCRTTAREPGEFTLSAECGVCSDASGPCATNQDCKPETGTCVTADADVPCTDATDCSTGICTGQCNGGADAGETCQVDQDCESDDCAARKCGAGNAGSQCTEASECDSDVCEFAAPTCQAPRCEFNATAPAATCQVFGGICAAEQSRCEQASDPLIQDVRVTVTYRSLVPSTRADPDNPRDPLAGTYVWELDVRTPGHPAPGTRVSGSQLYLSRLVSELPYGLGIFIRSILGWWGCGAIAINPLAPVALNDSITFRMRKGEVFTIEGRIAQIAYSPWPYTVYSFIYARAPQSCSKNLAPAIKDIPISAVACGISFNEAYTFDQLSSGQTQVVKLDLTKNQGGPENCMMELVLDIEVD